MYSVLFIAAVVEWHLTHTVTAFVLSSGDKPVGLADGGASAVLGSCPATSMVVPSPTPMSQNGSRGVDRHNATPWQKDLDSYHLIWSPGFARKIATTTLALALVHSLQTYVSMGFAREVIAGLAVYVPNWVASFYNNAVLPLLASACCLLQLGINLLAGGCAGFNTGLGPLRPYFLSLLIYSTATMTRRQIMSPCHQWTSFLLQTVFRWGIAMLPEFLHLYNTHRAPGKEKVVLFEPPASMTGSEAIAQIDIPTMGCVACINTIDSSLRRAHPGVVSASSVLNPVGSKGGQATIRFKASTDGNFNTIVEALLKSVNDAGFGEGCALKSVQVQSSAV